MGQAPGPAEGHLVVAVLGAGAVEAPGLGALAVVALHDPHAAEVLLGSVRDVGQALLDGGRLAMEARGQALHDHADRDHGQPDREPEPQVQRHQPAEADRNDHHGAERVHQPGPEEHAQGLHVGRQAADEVARPAAVVEGEVEACQVVEQLLLELDLEPARDDHDQPALPEAEEGVGQGRAAEQQQRGRQPVHVARRADPVEGLPDQDRRRDVEGLGQRDREDPEDQARPVLEEASEVGGEEPHRASSPASSARRVSRASSRSSRASAASAPRSEGKVWEP